MITCTLRKARTVLFTGAGLLVGMPLMAQDPTTAELAETIQELQERIDELEELALETDERVGSRALWSAFGAKSVDLGGHVTSVFTHLEGDDASETGHFTTFLELFFKIQLDEKWSVFMAPGFLVDNFPNQTNPRVPAISNDNPTSSVFLARAYLEYQQSEAFGVQVGLIGTPHGIVNREYFVPSRLVGQGPLHVRQFLTNQLYAQLFTGAKASGRLNLDDKANRAFIYDAYVGVETVNPNEVFTGGRAGYRIEDLGLEVAFNYSHGTRQTFAELNPTLIGLFPLGVNALQSPFPSQPPTRGSYDVFGFDIDWRKNQWVSKIELYATAEENAQDKRVMSYQLSYFWTPQIATTYRFDYFDFGYNLGVAREHLVSLMYSPIEAVRFRLDAHRQQLPNVGPGADDLTFVNLSMSASF